MPNIFNRLMARWRGESKAAGSDAAAAGRRLPTPGGYGGIGGGIWGFSGGRWFGRSSPIVWEDAAGDVTKNSAVAACLLWLFTSWPQAPPILVKKGADGQGEEQVGHPIIDLLREPSPDWGGRQFWAAVLQDVYTARGAYAYIISIVPETGEPLELQYLPPRAVVPIGPVNGKGLIDYYQYQSGFGVLKIAPADMLHFRIGSNPHNKREGWCVVDAVLPEIATDNEASRLQYKFLKRGGLGGIIIGPDGKGADGGVADLNDDDKEFIKAQLREKSEDANDNTLVMPVGFNFGKLGFNPSELVIGETQRKSEERIAAQFGLPPAVVGLGAGLDRSTFNNYEEARQAAWEDCVIPLQDIFSEEIQRKLFPRYADLAINADGLIFTWDRRGIRCLQDDESGKKKDAALLFKAGVIDRYKAKRLAGDTPEETDKGVYYAPAAGAGDEQDPANQAPAAVAGTGTSATAPTTGTKPPKGKGGRPGANLATFRY